MRIESTIILEMVDQLLVKRTKAKAKRPHAAAMSHCFFMNQMVEADLIGDGY